jgi:HSP20 family protein
MATVVRWEPLREVAAFQNEMSRFMNGLLEGNGQSTQSWVPTLDAWETEDAIVYAFDLPGIPEEKINVELDDGSLTVTAERDRAQTAKSDGFYRYERRFGTFTRTVGVPAGVTEADVSASYDNGVLEVHVKKPEQPKPRRIEIGGKQPQTIEGSAQEA